nr:hypothetical protein Iba_chr08dCG13070 [Ipomoea batatas]
MGPSTLRSERPTGAEIVTSENRTRVLPKLFPTKRAYLPLEATTLGKQHSPLSPWQLQQEGRHHLDLRRQPARNCSGDKRQNGETPADHREEAELRREMAVTPTRRPGVEATKSETGPRRRQSVRLNTFTLSPWQLHRRADIILICAGTGGNCSGDKRQNGETPADHREEAELRREMAVTPTALATKVKRAAAGDRVSGCKNISPVVIGTASISTALPSS